MAEIIRFSLTYDLAEDRIAWDMVDQEGETTRLWLTQRLCRALAQALFPMVTAEGAAADTPAPVQETLQAWEQEAAMANFGSIPAVQPKPSSRTGLVGKVHLTPNGESLNFTFEFGEGEQRVIGVGRAELRQTLAMIYRLHVAASWPTDVWPIWITEGETTVETTPAARH